PLLVPLALLAAVGLESVPGWLARPLDVLAVALAAILGLALWLGWAAFLAGWTPGFVEAPAPGFVPQLEPIATGAALAIPAPRAQAPAPGEGWQLLWRGTRPGDIKEFFWLYERSRAVAGS